MKYLYNIALLLCLLGVSACNDWLDVPPKTHIPTDKQFEAESGFKDALTGIYIKMTSPTLYGADLTYGYIEQLAGVYSNYPSFAQTNMYDQSIAYDFENTFLPKKNGIYGSMYNVLININSFLHHIDNRSDVVKTKHYVETMKGEALGLRAFIHFDLLRMFGPVYKDNPDGKAIPYRILFDREPTEVLSANKVLEAILKDLTEAEELLKKTDPLDFFTTAHDRSALGKDLFMVNREFRMNLYAVKAMLARVYACKGDAQSKESAVKYAREVIDASEYFNLYRAQTAASYNSVRYREQIFGLSINQFDKVLEGNYMNMTSTSNQYRFATSETNFNLFYELGSDRIGNTDWRRNPEMFEIKSNYAFCRKFNQATLLSAEEGKDAIPLIRLPEMYYIVAECAPDAQTSANALNEVRFARGISYNDEISTLGYDELDVTSKENTQQTKRINEIMKEYRKEFFAEGKLFYFLKAHGYQTFYGGAVEEMTAKQYVFPLPDNESTFGKH